MLFLSAGCAVRGWAGPKQTCWPATNHDSPQVNNPDRPSGSTNPGQLARPIPMIGFMDLHVTLPAGPGRRRALHEYLRDAVLEGHLRPGELLPPSRELASRLGVSRAT